MKTKIHPAWFTDTLVTCVCGKTFTIGSTKQTLNVDICSQCHPYFTGEMRYADSEGKIESFQKKMETAKKKAPELARKKAKKANLPQEDATPKSLTEMLMGV